MKQQLQRERLIGEWSSDVVGIRAEIFTSTEPRVECQGKCCECMKALKAVVLKQIYEQHLDLQIIKYIP
jgi:hypothetical protein